MWRLASAILALEPELCPEEYRITVNGQYIAYGARPRRWGPLPSIVNVDAIRPCLPAPSPTLFRLSACISAFCRRHSKQSSQPEL
jgi:hypothetical protein